jgi:hypothetical protein
MLITGKQLQALKKIVKGAEKYGIDEPQRYVYIDVAGNRVFAGNASSYIEYAFVAPVTENLGLPKGLNLKIDIKYFCMLDSVTSVGVVYDENKNPKWLEIKDNSAKEETKIYTDAFQLVDKMPDGFEDFFQTKQEWLFDEQRAPVLGISSRMIEFERWILSLDVTASIQIGTEYTKATGLLDGADNGLPKNFYAVVKNKSNMHDED